MTLDTTSPTVGRIAGLLADWMAARGLDVEHLTTRTLDQFYSQVRTPLWLKRRLTAALAADAPDPEAPEPPLWRPRPGQLDVAEALARIPRTGRDGLAGTRDGAILAARASGVRRHRMPSLAPRDVDTDTWEIAGIPIPATGEPVECSRCWVARWLALLAALPPVGFRADAMSLLARDWADEHACQAPAEAGEWQKAARLFASIDRHGWTGYGPLSSRSVAAICAYRLDPDTPARNLRPSRPASGGQPINVEKAKDEMWDLLDDFDQAADALAAKINALLAEHGVPLG